MPTYKDNKTGKWYCKFYYKDHKGNNKQKLKRGFSTQREAKEYEREFLSTIEVQLDIPFNKFVDIYMDSVKPKIRYKTYISKQKRHKRILEYFSDIPMEEITSNMVNDFLNTLIEDNLANNTINDLKKEISSIFNHAKNFYNFNYNPTHNLGKIYNPNQKPKEYNIWELKDYKKAIDLIDDISLKTLINLLYWSGIRIGEALALTWNDIDLINFNIKINKSYQRIKGQEFITPTKTYNKRTILLPNETIEQLKEYKKSLYDLNNRLFLYSSDNYLQRIKKLCKDYNLPKITTHDLRHSHASYLLSNRVNIVLISKRLGHKDVTTTLNTYSHFMPNDEIDFIKQINNTQQ